MKVLVLNEIGLGNAVLEVPFLLAIDRDPNVEALFLQHSMFRSWIPRLFRKHTGHFPSEWAINQDFYIPALLPYIKHHGISRLVNLRNENYSDPQHAQYRVFRGMAVASGVDVWDIDDIPSVARRRYIADQWVDLFARHNVCVNCDTVEDALRAVADEWRFESRAPCVLYLGGSRPDKRLHHSVWHAVADSVSRMVDVPPVIVSGVSDEERIDATRVHGDLSLRFGLGMATPRTLDDLCQVLLWSSVVVSADTFALHLAHALGVPVVGLYATTDRRIWGPPDSGRFVGIMSSACVDCVHMSQQGTCGYRKTHCKMKPNVSFNADAVAQSISSLLRERNSRSDRYEFATAGQSFT